MFLLLRTPIPGSHYCNEGDEVGAFEFTGLCQASAPESHRNLL